MLVPEDCGGDMAEADEPVAMAARGEEVTLGETSEESDRGDLPDLVALIEAAFEGARAAGKEPWNVMTVAVLKNRLLDLTDRQFSEKAYGASSISNLARRLPEILELDESVKPPRVTLRARIDQGSQESYVGRLVRRDLWNAVVDYARGEPYVWSGAVAVRRDAEEVSDAAPVLPTLTREEAAAWRAEFVEGLLGGADPAARNALERWRDDHLGTRALPASLQGHWNEEFKRRVVTRLRDWFMAQGIPEPIDLLLPSRKSTPQAKSRVEELRALVIRCVQNMTAEELSELRLPPEALLRGKR